MKSSALKTIFYCYLVGENPRYETLNDNIDLDSQSIVLRLSDETKRTLTANDITDLEVFNATEAADPTE